MTDLAEFVALLAKGAVAFFAAVVGTFGLVQLITYAYLTAKYRFEQSHQPTDKEKTNGD